MIWCGRVSGQKGLTIVELLIATLLAAVVGGATFKFYAAQHELYLAQVDIADRQGNLRFSLDNLAHQIRRAGYLVKGGGLMRTAASFDTLEIFVGNDSSLTVDTIRYYVNRYDVPPSLVRQVNQTTPAIFAQGIDTALFVPVGGPPAKRIAVTLVSVAQKQYENSALTTRRRFGQTINLRNW